MKKLFLLDGHALVYRAHFAFITRPLLNSKGWNVSAVQGFVRTLWDIINVQKPTHLAVAFDPKGGTFRHTEYEPYKAQREAQPEDITFALPWIQKVLEGMRIPVVIVPNYEADDVIGTLAKQAEKEDFEVYMVTPDKDFGQLVTDRIKMYKPGKMGNEAEIWGVKEVCENWDIKRVEQVIDMLGLMGDAADNIPGLPGIGPKSAQKLLAEYDTIENLLANADKLSGKQKEIIETHKDKAVLSKWLATIDINSPIQFDATRYEIEPFDRESLLDTFRELEFRSLAQTILGSDLGGGKNTAPAPQSSGTATPAKKTTKSVESSSMQGSLFSAEENAAMLTGNIPAAPAMKVADHHIKNTPHTYHLTNTPEEIAALIAKLKVAPSITYDSETTNIDATQAELVGFSFAVVKGEAWYVPVPANQAAAQTLVELFRPIFEDENIEKVGQNLKYDAIVLKNYGVELRGKYFDTMIAHYLWEPELRHNMNYLSESYLNYSPIKIEELIGKKGLEQGGMRTVELPIIADYACEDADVTFQLREYLEPKLRETNMEKLFHDIEMPLVKVLTDLEFAGVRIDARFLKQYSQELAILIVELEEKILKEVGTPFNIGSPKQVGEILFDVLKYPYPGKKMKSGNYSTDEEILSNLADAYPVCADILRHRGLMKLKSTYVEALPKMVNPRTGRVHSSFNQALASTGRLSSNNPNLQNIPIKTPEGRRVREAFIPRDENYVLLSADYSQVELRLIAEISHETAMLEAFQQGLDIHTATASKVYGVPLAEVTPDQRRNAKTVNFSIIYGAGASNLSSQLGIKRTDAKVLIDNYFEQYKGLKAYMDNTVEFARKHGYVETLIGRRRILRDINSQNGMMRTNSERMAINSPIQGTAADLVKIAMVNIHEVLTKGNYRSKMILQVHDELVFDIHKDELETLKPIIIDLMSKAIPNLSVPILVEAGVGNNWLEAH